METVIVSSDLKIYSTKYKTLINFGVLTKMSEGKSTFNTLSAVFAEQTISINKIHNMVNSLANKNNPQFANFTGTILTSCATITKGIITGKAQLEGLSENRITKLESIVNDYESKLLSLSNDLKHERIQMGSYRDENEDLKKKLEDIKKTQTDALELLTLGDLAAQVQNLLGFIFFQDKEYLVKKEDIIYALSEEYQYAPHMTKNYRDYINKQAEKAELNKEDTQKNFQKAVGVLKRLRFSLAHPTVYKKEKYDYQNLSAIAERVALRLGFDPIRSHVETLILIFSKLALDNWEIFDSDTWKS